MNDDESEKGLFYRLLTRNYQSLFRNEKQQLAVMAGQGDIELGTDLSVKANRLSEKYVLNAERVAGASRRSPLKGHDAHRYHPEWTRPGINTEIYDLNGNWTFFVERTQRGGAAIEYEQPKTPEEFE